MSKFIRKALNAGRNFTLSDFAGLKITLFSLGILFGAYFSPFFLRHTLAIWIIFILSYVWLMYRTFIKHWD